MLKLAQHLRDEGGPFLVEADLVHGPPDGSIVTTSALVPVDQLVAEQRLVRLPTVVVNTTLVDVAFHGDVEAVVRRGEQGRKDVLRMGPSPPPLPASLPPGSPLPFPANPSPGASWDCRVAAASIVVSF